MDKERIIDNIIEFMCFWDSRLNKRRVKRRYNELVKEEAIRRGECPIAFAKKLDGGIYG